MRSGGEGFPREKTNEPPKDRSKKLVGGNTKMHHRVGGQSAQAPLQLDVGVLG
jgi:hypothetical protein